MAHTRSSIAAPVTMSQISLPTGSPVGGPGPVSAGTLVVPSTSRRNDSAAHGLTVLALLNCVRRRWKQATVLGIVLGGLAAMGVYMFLPPAKPYAYTSLYFPAKPAGSIDHPDPPVNQQTQKALVTSKIVLREVVETPEIAALEAVQERTDPATWLLRELTIDFPTGSEIMRITLSDVRVEDAKKIVDQIAKTYMSKIANESAEYRRIHLEKLRTMASAARSELEKELNATKQGSTGTVAASSPEVIAQRQQMINNEIVHARNEVRKSQSQLQVLKGEEARLSARLAKTPVEITQAEFEPLFAQNPKANQLKQYRDELQGQYDLKSVGLGPDNPDMVRMKNQIDGVESRLESLRKDLRGTISLAFQERLTDDLRKVRDELARFKAEEQSFQTLITTKQEEFDKLRDATTDAGRLKPGIHVKSTRVEELESKLLKLEYEMGAPVGVRSLEREAEIVRPNDASRRIKMAGVAAAAFFCIAFAFLGFLEFRANRIPSPDFVTAGLGLPLIGVVPGREKGDGGLNDREWEAVLDESVDSARTVFLHNASVRNLRTVMVSSAVGGEGKTTLTCRLAASLARSGRKTLVIDADLRNPSVHTAYGAPGGPGTCEVLRGEFRTGDVIKPVGLENLWLIAAGRCDRIAIQMLAQDGFARIISDARQHGFDFILIDSSPILPVADALLVGRHADGVLLSLMCDVSQVERVNTACRRLASIDVPLLGAVMNGTRSEVYGYGPRYVASALA